MFPSVVEYLWGHVLRNTRHVFIIARHLLAGVEQQALRVTLSDFARITEFSAENHVMRYALRVTLSFFSEYSEKRHFLSYRDYL